MFFFVSFFVSVYRSMCQYIHLKGVFLIRLFIHKRMPQARGDVWWTLGFATYEHWTGEERGEGVSYLGFYPSSSPSIYLHVGIIT